MVVGTLASDGERETRPSLSTSVFGDSRLGVMGMASLIVSGTPSLGFGKVDGVTLGLFSASLLCAATSSTSTHSLESDGPPAGLLAEVG